MLSGLKKGAPITALQLRSAQSATMHDTVLGDVWLTNVAPPSLWEGDARSEPVASRLGRSDWVRRQRLADVALGAPAPIAGDCLRRQISQARACSALIM